MFIQSSAFQWILKPIDNKRFPEKQQGAREEQQGKVSCHFGRKTPATYDLYCTLPIHNLGNHEQAAP